MTPSSSPTMILLETGSCDIQIAYLGYPFDHFFMKLLLFSPAAQHYTLPTYIKDFYFSAFSQGSFVFETLAFSLDIGLMSAVAIKKLLVSRKYM